MCCARRRRLGVGSFWGSIALIVLMKERDPALYDAKNDPEAEAVESGGNPEDESVTEKDLENVAVWVENRQSSEQASPREGKEEDIAEKSWAGPRVMVRGPHQNVEHGGNREGQGE